MGRKPTLQPLALADANSLTPGAETALSAIASPADARSPRSLRTAPFTTTRFGSCPKSQPPLTGRSVPDDFCQQHQHLLQQDQSLSQQQQQQQADHQQADYQQADHQQHHHHQQQQQQQQQRSNPSARDDPTALSSNNYSPVSAVTPSQGSRNIVSEGPRPNKGGGFFQFNKGSKSVGQFPTTQSHNFPESRSQILSRGSDGAADVSRNKDFFGTDDPQHKPFPSLSDLSIPSSLIDAESIQSPSYLRKNKSKSFGLLSRSKSSHSEIESPKASPMALPSTPSTLTLTESNTPLRTTPSGPDRPHRDIMSSATRTFSEDRTASHDLYGGRDNYRDKENYGQKDHSKDKDHKAHHATLLRDTGALILFNGIRNSSTRAADLLSKGLFGKASRSGSTNQREPMVDDEHYVLKVLNLPLVEQTRLTRISKRLEDSRDKTEFWMPSFPWRAIDYLNYKGCEVEGLYRVPGSGPQVKKWQRKFDEHFDVNLFEETDLYDINIIGSMLKAWLRELPDELFPKEAQERVARECAGAETVPPLLIEELSNLPPFNYYLLFAITCHLSLLLAHSDKNKMDFRNLCICFQPCMKIDAFCFKFLVCEWRDCWNGCRNEARYIEEEYLLFDQPPPRGLSDGQPPQQPATIIREEQHPPPPILDLPPGQGNGGRRLNKHQLQLTKSSESIASRSSTISTDMTADSENEAEVPPTVVPGLTPVPTNKSRDLRPLSPIQPLSPLGF